MQINTLRDSLEQLELLVKDLEERAAMYDIYAFYPEIKKKSESIFLELTKLSSKVRKAITERNLSVSYLLFNEILSLKSKIDQSELLLAICKCEQNNRVKLQSL